MAADPSSARRGAGRTRPPAVAELREDTPVTLAPDGETFGVGCRVVGFHRALIVLERAAATGWERERAAPGARGYVVCGTGDRPAALRVEIMRVAGARVVLRLLDRFALGQQRVFSRLEAQWPITLDTATGPVSTRTIDVSAGGALVRAAVALPAGCELRIQLELPGGRPPVSARARVTRATRRGMALRFLDLAPSDEARVAEVVLDALGAGGVRASRPLDDAPRPA